MEETKQPAQGEKKQVPKRIKQNELIDVFLDVKNPKISSSVRFCFLVGAGASKSSDIKDGKTLAQEWFDYLKDKNFEQDEIEKWKEKNKVNADFTRENAGEFYPFLYEKRYNSCTQIGYDYFQKLMADKRPSIGYVILSQILDKEKHKFVITPNFDFLIEDAIRNYTSIKPFVVGHESLARYINTQTTRPTIIKVHRDLYLQPFNDNENTYDLKEEWKKPLTRILENSHLLVIGYGGNDGSLMNFLSQIDINDRKPIYWCKRNGDTLNNKVTNLLKTNDYVVEIENFDDLMYNLYTSLGYDILENLESPEKHPFVIAANERIKELDGKVKDLIAQRKPDEKKEEILKGVTATNYLLKAYNEKDISKKEQIYKDGLEKYPNDEYLHAWFASFLFESGKIEEGNSYYEKAIQLKENAYDTYFNWGADLGNLAATKTGVEAKKLYLEAFEKYQKAIDIKPDYADAYNNWANALGNLADTKTGVEAEKLYLEACEKYQKAIEINPDFAEAYNNWGNNLGNLADTKIGTKAEKLYMEAFDKYQKAIEINPDYADTYNNWGSDLGNLAETKTEIEAEELYLETFEKFKKAIDIKPNLPEAYNNWGNALGNFAKTKTGNEASKLYLEASEKFKKAIDIKPDYAKAYSNWGYALGRLAETKIDEEAEKLYLEASEKFKKAIDINPNYYKAYNNWAGILLYQARNKTQAEKETLYNQASDLSRKAYELGGKCYNLACAYALKQDKENALHYLEIALTNKEISLEHVQNKDDDWAFYREDEDFKRLLEKFE